MATILGIILACFFLTSGARGNWKEGSQDPTHSKLGLYVEYMACDANVCVKPYKMTLDRKGTVQHNFTFTESPYDFLLDTSSALSQSHMLLNMTQENQEPFRLCAEYETAMSTYSKGPLKIRRCLDSFFEGITIPAE
ncbi:uncharacterized protein LOC110989827 isoform X2 [Acanthaster planci]|nr:uncharacterized protein LOC110989827 isoform X2 [Acanthaster planci]